jgi:hypothetical protein
MKNSLKKLFKNPVRNLMVFKNQKKIKMNEMTEYFEEDLLIDIMMTVSTNRIS